MLALQKSYLFSILKIYESGCNEGSLNYYLDYYLAPEIKEFKSFIFSDYKIHTTVSSKRK